MKWQICDFFKKSYSVQLKFLVWWFLPLFSMDSNLQRQESEVHDWQLRFCSFEIVFLGSPWETDLKYGMRIQWIATKNL